MFDSAYLAAQESLRSFKTLPQPCLKTFIFTGNALNQIAIPGVMPYAFGKVAAAMLIEYAANAYGRDGYRFVLLCIVHCLIQLPPQVWEASC